MDYPSVKEADKKWDIIGRMAALYCVQGSIDGAVKKKPVAHAKGCSRACR